MRKNKFRALVTLGIGVGVLVSACAPSPEQPDVPPVQPISQVTTAAGSASPSPNADASASTTGQSDPGTQTTDPTGLKAGTNHNEAASDYAYPAKSVQAWIKTASKGATPTKKTVFLTFDDGPSTMTPRILDTLKAKGVHATFFIIGSQVKGNEALLKRAIAEGHAVAIHTYSHNYNYLYPGRTGNAERVVADRAKAVAAVQGVLGSNYVSSAYRYPGGHMSWKGLGPADDALAAQGVYWIDWNAMTGDAEPASRRPKTVAASVAMAETGISQGTKAIVMLAHDTPGSTMTLQGLPAIIDAYKAAGYTFGIIA